LRLEKHDCSLDRVPKEITKEPMMKETSERVRNVQVLSTIVLFLAGGGLIGSTAYVSFIPSNTRTVLKAGMVAISLAAWLVLSRSERLRQYRPNSIWGPVLIHAAGDVLVILGFLAAANL
jgi:hypothetical protein